MSIIFLDYSNVYITEIDSLSSNNFTWIIFIFLNVFIFFGFWFGLKAFNVCRPSLNVSRSFEAKSTMPLLTLIVIIYAINFILSDSLPGLNDDVRRFDYWEKSSAFPILPNIFGTLVFFFPITVISLLLFYIKIKPDRVLCSILVFYLILYFIYLFLTGQKFNGFMLSLLGLYAILVNVSDPLQLNLSMPKVRKAGIVLVFFILLIGIADLMSRDFAQQLNLSGAAFYRILVLQGSTFWGIYNSYLESGIQRENIYEVLTVGSDLIKFIIMPAGSAESFIENEINLSGNITGYLLIFFGLTGAIIISFIYGVLLSLTSVELIKNIIRFRFFEVIIVSMIWLSVIACYSRGSLENIFSFKTIVLVVALVIIKLVRRI
jgi:hypothetical protein